MVSVSSPAGHEHRRVPRDPVSFRTDLATSGAPPLRVLVVDISPLGLMARAPEAPAPGAAVEVSLPLVGARRGVLRWSLGGRIGIEFDEPIAADAYTCLLAVAPREAPAWGER